VLNKTDPIPVWSEALDESMILLHLVFKCATPAMFTPFVLGSCSSALLSPLMAGGQAAFFIPLTTLGE